MKAIAMAAGDAPPRRDGADVPAAIGPMLRRSLWLLAIVAIAGVAIVPLRGEGSLPYRYFFEQDLYLLAVAAVLLLLLGRLRADVPLVARGRWLFVAALAAALVAYLGAGLAFAGFGPSRDEVMFELAADYFAQGRLASPVPQWMTPIAEAAMPLWTERWLSRGYWTSQYLPVNSMLRAGAVLLGDRWLMAPLVLLAGAWGLWSAARRLWPDRRQGAIVALVLALTSTQVIVNAMTAYAMTAHFALNALWIAAFVRGGKAGHGAALALGLLATGLHQAHFHLMFVSGFILWSWLDGRRRIACLYALACCGYYVAWDYGWEKLVMPAMLGPLPVAEAAQPGLSLARLLSRVARLRELEPVNSFARFAAWQNVLLLPLAYAGTRAARGGDGRRTIVFALSASCLIGLVTMVYQGHGYGYRYLHGLIPCFCLLAAAGWLRLQERMANPPGAWLLWGSAAAAVLVTLPLATWMSARFVAPYRAAHAAARAAPAPFVLVDVSAGAFLQDIVRIDRERPFPMLLDLALVDRAVLARLCARRQVMLFGHAQARAMGVPPAFGAFNLNHAEAARNRAMLERWGCAPAVPIG